MCAKNFCKNLFSYVTTACQGVMHAFDLNCTVKMRIGRVVLGVLKTLHSKAQCCFSPAGGAVAQRLSACRVFNEIIKTMFSVPFSVSLCLSWVVVSSLCLYLSGIYINALYVMPLQTMPLLYIILITRESTFVVNNIRYRCFNGIFLRLYPHNILQKNKEFNWMCKEVFSNHSPD